MANTITGNMPTLDFGFGFVSDNQTPLLVVDLTQIPTILLLGNGGMLPNPPEIRQATGVVPSRTRLNGAIVHTDATIAHGVLTLDMTGDVLLPSGQVNTFSGTLFFE